MRHAPPKRPFLRPLQRLQQRLHRGLRRLLRALPARRMQGLSVALVLGWAGFVSFGPLHWQGVAPATLDWLQRHRLWASAPDPRLLLVDIDERSLAELAPEFGRWPWPRDTLASVLSHAQDQGALAVVFDVLFSDPDRLRPGGDQALAAAVAQSPRGYYPVLRLPAANDGASALRLDQLPGLALPGPLAQQPAPTAALVLPFMASMLDSRRLGHHTATLDADGMLRRHALAEDLRGWALLSMPWVVAQAVRQRDAGTPPDDWARWTQARPIVWRARADLYPRVPFAQIWACAEGARTRGCPSLAGKIVLIGATAPSLHDLRNTPLAANHAGLDILATLIDNALHDRQFHELSGPQRFALTLAGLALALWAARRAGVDGTARVLVQLPLAMLLLVWLSLHTERWLLDLMLPAASVLLYLSLLRSYDGLRRRTLGLHEQAPPPGSWAVWLRARRDRDEQIERAVLDIAASAGLEASACADACGLVDDRGGLPSLWVLWRLPDRATGAALCQRLQSDWPMLASGLFSVQPGADHGLYAALAQSLPAPAASG